MSKQYNILWLDDKFETLQNIRRAAKTEGIILTPFTSFEEGFEHLKANISKYDGILLDALFYESKDQTAGSEDSKGLNKAIDKINELKYKKVFPLFVLSGQTSFTNQKHETLTSRNIRCYLKGKSQDLQELFKDIKEQADKLLDTQLKHKHSKSFAACSEAYIGESTGNDLLNILKKVESDNTDTDLFNSTRKIIEDLFKALNRHKLLPDAFVENSVSLTPTSKFLAGKEALGYTLKEESKLPLSICDELYFVLHIVQSGSHSSDLTARLKLQNTPYLTNSTINIMLDILVWFKNHIDSNPTKENWTDSNTYSHQEWISGTVQSCQAGLKFITSGSHTEVLLQNNIVTKYNLKDGNNIEIQKEHPKSTNITKVRKVRS